MDIMTLGKTRKQLRRAFDARYPADPGSVRHLFVPYRICPLGAHIDHQLGPVTAMAIDHGIQLAYTPLRSPEMRLSSLEFPGEVRFPINAPGQARAGDWGNYARGAAYAIARSGRTLNHGFAGVITGPWSESGLSSSAAVGLAYLLALEDVNGLSTTDRDNIALDRTIENEYLGIRNGILDQSAILLSRKHHLTCIDCATETHSHIPQPEGMPPWCIILAFSGLKKSLTSTGYNNRVAECAEAARIVLKSAAQEQAQAHIKPGDQPRLGHVPEETYVRHKDRLPEPLDRRAAHFFSEAARVRQGIAAWKRGDLRTFGALMTASGESSIKNYECGCPPLIDLYRIMTACSGIYGARFSGAGFRGCCIGLADPDKAPTIIDRIKDEYTQAQPDLASRAFALTRRSDDGARLLTQRPEGLSRLQD